MIVFYVSGHGFGHASRDIEVINALIRHRPDLPLIVRSGVPSWLFEASAQRRLDVHPLETDSGVAQQDSLRHDPRETARRAVRFYEIFDDRVAAEATWLTSQRATLVIADVPPLACAAAARAEIPSIVIANFTWDWIYRGFDGFEALAPGIVATMERAYATATHALRLPLHGGFATFGPVIRDIPFVARRSAKGRMAVRHALGLDASRPIVLASFGGHGVQLPYDVVAGTNEVTVLMTEFEGESNPGVAGLPNVRCLTSRELAAKHLRHDDLVAAADVVVSKPGYGIVSECIANGTALLYTSRGQFPEYDVMVEAMPRMLRCRYIAQEALLAGRWTEAVDALLQQPAAPTHPMVNGADVAADFVLKSCR
jgi:hypothetical protein